MAGCRSVVLGPTAVVFHKQVVGNGQKISYFCLVTRMKSGAVYLEVAYPMGMSFSLQTPQCFVNRRGVPSTI